MPALVEIPAIERPNRKGKSKYVNGESLEETVKLMGKGWVGELITPVDTIVKARIAARTWKKALSERMTKPEDAFAVRVYSPKDAKGKTIPDQFTFAIALKQGA